MQLIGSVTRTRLQHPPPQLEGVTPGRLGSASDRDYSVLLSAYAKMEEVVP
jgi:hypothetical protein